jgi:inosose dehydratase
MSTKPKLSPDKVHIGVTPTLWWNDDFINIDIGIPFEQAISEMALAGYVGCSLGHKYPSDPATLRAALDLRGMRISEPWVSTYFTINEMKAQTIKKVRQQLAFIEVMETDSDSRRADLVVAEFGRAVNPLPLALIPNCPVFDDREWDLLVEGLHDIGKIAREEGRRLCYHPHLGTGVMRADAVERLMNSTDPELVHLLVDTGHLAAVYVDPLEITRKFASRVRHMHLKDVRADAVRKMHEEGLSFEEGIQAGIFTVPGDGSIKSFPEIFEVLAEANFDGWLIIEAEQNPAKATPLKYAKMGRAYLREHLGF